MSAERASIWDEDLDVSGFAPKPSDPAAPAVPEEAVRAVSEQAFPSREPAGPKHRQKKIRQPRTHRTGRNISFNIKVRAEALEAFYQIADDEEWVLGETFEHAVDALKRELAAKAKSS